MEATPLYQAVARDLGFDPELPAGLTAVPSPGGQDHPRDTHG